MRALVLNEIGSLRVEERPTPDPGPTDILIRVTATGICGSDIHGYTGENGRRFPGQIMGHESAGTVAAIGERNSGFPLRLGQSVTFNPVVVPEDEVDVYAGREQHCPRKVVIGVAPDVDAALADYVVVPARNVITMPDDMPIENGALVEPLAVAVHGVRRILREDVKRALVIGGGPIGQSTVLALKMHGIREIFVSEPDLARLQLCGRLGAISLDTLSQSLMQALESEGGLVDIAVDAVGTTTTVNQALEATKPGGSVCLVGMGAPRVDLDAYQVSTAERALVGSFTYATTDFSKAAKYIGTNPAEARELISCEVSPSEADATFRALAEGEGPPGKVLVRFDR